MVKKLTKKEKNILFAASYIKGSQKFVDQFKKEVEDGSFEKMLRKILGVKK